MNNLSEYINKALEYKNNSDYKKAIDYFYKALALNNDDCQIMLELADLYIKLSRYDRAVYFYEQVLINHSDFYNVKFDLALLYKNLSESDKAQSLLQELFEADYDIQKTAELYFEVLILNRNFQAVIDLYTKKKENLLYPQILVLTARAYLCSGDDIKAYELYDEAYNMDNNNAEAVYYKANLLFEKGETDSALQLLKNITDISKDDKVYRLIADICYSKGNLDSALNYYSKAVNLNNKNSIYYYKLGLVFSLKGYFNEALQSYTKAINLEPLNTDYNFALAYLYYTAKNYKKAQTIVDSILQTDKENIKALSLKIILSVYDNECAKSGKLIEKIKPFDDDFALYAQTLYYLALNLTDKAKEAIIKAVNLNKNSLEYKYTLASVYFEQNDLQNALNICDDIISINPKYIQAYILKAKILLQQSQIIEFNQVIDMAKALDVNSHEIYYLLALNQIKAQNPQEALNNLKIALSVNPSVEKYYALIAKIYFDLFDYENAYLYYKEAAQLDMTNPDYRYYMAQCSCEMGRKEDALSNFSIMKRLQCNNIKYLETYILYCAKIGNKKFALQLLKTLLKDTKNNDSKSYLKSLEKEIKKGC